MKNSKLNEKEPLLTRQQLMGMIYKYFYELLAVVVFASAFLTFAKNVYTLVVLVINK